MAAQVGSEFLADDHVSLTFSIFLLLLSLFLYYIYLLIWGRHMPYHSGGHQRRTCRHWSSPSIMGSQGRSQVVSLAHSLFTFKEHSSLKGPSLVISTANRFPQKLRFSRRISLMCTYRIIAKPGDVPFVPGVEQY